MKASFRQAAALSAIASLLIFAPAVYPQVTFDKDGHLTMKAEVLKPLGTRNQTTVGRITEIGDSTFEYKVGSGTSELVYMMKDTEVLDVSKKRISLSELKVGDHVRVLSKVQDVKLSNGTAAYASVPLRVEKLPAPKPQ